jgi:hypothetical protein
VSSRNQRPPIRWILAGLRQEFESIAHQALMDLTSGLHDLSESGAPIPAKKLGSALKIRDEAARTAARSMITYVTAAAAEARNSGENLPGNVALAASLWVTDVFDQLTDRLGFRLDDEALRVMSATRKWKEMVDRGLDPKKYVRSADIEKGCVVFAATYTFKSGLDGSVAAEIKKVMEARDGRPAGEASEPPKRIIDQGKPLRGRKDICDALRVDPSKWRWLVDLSRAFSGPLHGGTKGKKLIVHEISLRDWFQTTAEKWNQSSKSAADAAKSPEFQGERMSGTSAKSGMEIPDGTGSAVPIKKRRSDLGKKRNPAQS